MTVSKITKSYATILFRGGGGVMIGELTILFRGGGGVMIGELTAATILFRGGGGVMIGELTTLFRGGGGVMIGELTSATILFRGGGGVMIGEQTTDPLTPGKTLVLAGFAIATALDSTNTVLTTTPQAFNEVETMYVHLLDKQLFVFERLTQKVQICTTKVLKKRKLFVR
jgi:hypothetical protein